MSFQVCNVRSTDLPLLLDVARQTLPEGVTLSVKEHTVEDYEAR